MLSSPALVAIADLEPQSWVRFADGEVGVIRDKVEQPGYRKAWVDVADPRHPVRVISLDTHVEPVTKVQGRSV